MSWPINDAQTLGWIVRDHRLELEISQDELATRAGVGRQWLSGLEAGSHQNPSLTRVLRVLQELNVNVRAHDDVSTEPAVRPSLEEDYESVLDAVISAHTDRPPTR